MPTSNPSSILVSTFAATRNNQVSYVRMALTFPSRFLSQIVFDNALTSGVRMDHKPLWRPIF